MIVAQYFLLTCAVVFTILTISYWLKKRRFFALAKELPGPPTYPFVGNLLDFMRLDYSIIEILKIMGQYKGLARFWLGHELTVAITDPDYLEVLYNSDALLARPDQYTPIEDWVGEGGLVTAGGESWKKARKIIIQNFHAITPDELSSVIATEAQNLVESLQKFVGKGFFEISPIIRRNGSIIITRIAINEDLADNKELDEVLHSIEELTRISVLRYLSPTHYFYPIFCLTKEGKTFARLKRDLRDVMRRIILRKQKEYNEMVNNGEEIPNSFIYNLFQNHGNESIENLTTHLITLIVSAVDTSADTIGFTLLMAAIFPDVQEKLHAEDLEIQSRFGGAELGPAVLHHYQFLDRVVKETLRLFPGFPMTGRRATEDVKMGKYTIPKGTNVLALTYYTNRRGDLFPNPTKFDPDRFLSDNAKNIHPFAFLPFGVGLRNCAGTKYALLTIKIEVITLIRTFKISSEYKNVEDVEKNLFADVVLRDRNRVKLRLDHRT